MAYLPKTKIFGGKRYRLHNDYLKRNIAETVAQMLRGKNWKARIVRLLGLWGVYKRMP